MLWEYMVEGMLRWTKQLDGYLVFYAEGVDGGMSMRYSEPEARYTHEVCFVPREGSSLRERISNREIVFPERGLALEEFVSCTDERPYARRPPFDFVQARDVPEALNAGYPLLFAREDVRFILSVAEPDYY